MACSVNQNVTKNKTICVFNPSAGPGSIIFILGGMNFFHDLFLVFFIYRLQA